MAVGRRRLPGVETRKCQPKVAFFYSWWPGRNRTNDTRIFKPRAGAITDSYRCALPPWCFCSQACCFARVGFNYLNYKFTGNTSDADYDFDMKLQTFDALLDWFPMDSQLRISAGGVSNGNEIKAVAKPAANGTYQFQGNTYDGAHAGRIDGNIAFKKVVPYLGVGWGNAVAMDKGWGFSSDLGILFQGAPE